MQLIVQNSPTLQGQVTPPSSKSQSIRGLFLALLANGASTLNNTLASDDIEDAARVCSQLGMQIAAQGNTLTLTSSGVPIAAANMQLNTGNSGITTRFVLPILGLRQNSDQPITVDCGAQMRARPIQSLVEALRHLGLTIEYLAAANQLPITLRGRLRGGTATVDGITSQYLSALLIALPCAENNSEIIVGNLHERPYMEMTLQWLKEQGIHYTHEKQTALDIYHIQGQQRYQPFTTTIAGDFSSASYLIAGAALTAGSVTLTGLNMQDPQGDKRLIPILQAMGADIKISGTHMTIHGGQPLHGISIDANDIPDLLPTLAVIATQASGKTVITNVRQARIKETDRIHSMTEGLTRLGAHIEEQADGMTIYQSHLRGARVNGYQDHRSVMALALAGLLAEGTTRIDDGEAIDKTFPTFVETLQTLGANIEVHHDTLR